MTMVIKVFTPIKRVPTMIGKAQNGQKLPFGPYTLPQVGAFGLLLAATSIAAMTIPINPAITFVSGLIVTGLTVLALGLVPYTGVRMVSRALWIARVVLVRKPVSASGVPIDAESARQTLFIEETIALILPESPFEVGHAPIEESATIRSLLGSGENLTARMNGSVPGVAVAGR
ncbi:hypothetical protein ACFYO1_02290 [Nocardia sp. NPDC006044]|uniref:hypothetical protein n=1 Tax=Nocardia sp. NPDC006044 TaxID=3364306 RepID=UPI0036AC8613